MPVGQYSDFKSRNSQLSYNMDETQIIRNESPKRINEQDQESQLSELKKEINEMIK